MPLLKGFAPVSSYPVSALETIIPLSHKEVNTPVKEVQLPGYPLPLLLKILMKLLYNKYFF